MNEDELVPKFRLLIWDSPAKSRVVREKLSETIEFPPYTVKEQEMDFGGPCDQVTFEVLPITLAE